MTSSATFRADHVGSLLRRPALLSARQRCDAGRARGFEPLRHVPAGAMVLLGLVSSKSAALEPADALARRIDEAARFIDLGRLALSPQCGFALPPPLALPGRDRLTGQSWDSAATRTRVCRLESKNSAQAPVDPAHQGGRQLPGLVV